MNIGRLLDSLLLQSYPRELVEIIVVNDNSEDGTVSVVNRYKEVKLLHMDNAIRNSYKKRGIEIGIGSATGDFIVTTDADCFAGPEWLAEIAAKIEETDAVFIAAPVLINESGSVVERFQAMDFMVLQGVTAVGVSRKTLSMCNGANMAYKRDVFYEVNGFQGIDNLASGDDMLLLHKIRTRYPDRISYIKSQAAIIQTNPVENWKGFFNQRIRWASKAAYYDDKKITATLIIVYIFNLLFPILLVTGFVDPMYWIIFASLLILKTLVELPFFISLSKFYKKKKLISSFILYQPLHICYTIAAGFLGQIGRYEWKGRKVK
jgi:cellulose synthase/poly-beta-1,6-N-acetylglucosamine synthase-like glycosyltransferase